MLKTKRSQSLHERAKLFLPAGVSYFLRYFEPYPFYAVKAKGSKIIDVDGNEYIDFWIGHYSLILGHSPPEVVNEVKQQIENGTHYGICHELELSLAEQIVKMVPSAEMVRFTNSGTEAIMYTVRLARTCTSREKIAKFEGGWHGGYDALHIGVNPPFNAPESGGLTSGAIKDTIILPYNNLEEAEKVIRRQELAAVIIEPVLGAGGCIPADREFLRGLREVCTETGTLLIFDEVITGFRLAPGGAQEYFGVLPDITVLGKIMGGGFPAGAIAGSKEIMEHMNPLLYQYPNFSFHGGTFSANPITMTAGLATLRILEDGKVLRRLNMEGEQIRNKLSEIFERYNVDVQVTGICSLFHTHFTRDEVKDPRAVHRADRKALANYHAYLLAKGVFFLPMKMGGLSRAHSREDIEKFLLETENYAKSIRNE